MILHVGRDSDSYTYELSPRSRLRIKQAFPAARMAPSISVGCGQKDNFEQVHVPIAQQVLSILTGLTMEQIASLGGARVYDPMHQVVLWQWEPDAKLVQDWPR